MKTGMKSRKGAVLVIVAISMVAAAAAGLAILSVSTSSRYERLGLNSSSRAYFMAESGAEFVRSRDSAVRTTLSGTYTDAGGDQFVIVVTTNAQGWVVVQSIGIANPGTALESRQQVHFEFTDRGMTSGQQPTSFFDGSGNFDTNAWSVDGGLNPVYDSGTGGLEIKKGAAGILSLTWYDNPSTLQEESSTLCREYTKQTNTLGYDVQIKEMPYDQVGTGYGDHFMMGISFRLQKNGGGYGLSYFHAPTNPAPNKYSTIWVTNLNTNFSVLRDTNVYVVLWFRTNSSSRFQLINSRRLVPSDGVTTYDAGNNMWGLIPFSTLLLQLKEGNSSNGIQNQISAYIQSPVLSAFYPTNYPNWPSNNAAYAAWQNNSNVFPSPMVWSDGVRTNFDSRILSSTNYCNILTVTNADGTTTKVYDGPPEIGIHVYYDQDSANKEFFDDFAVKFPRRPYGGAQVQY